MDLFIFIFEIIGTAAFAVSGALTGLGKHMDIFGVCILGLTTATGGGMIRDLVLGITPPAMFENPIYVAISIAVSVVVFLPFVRRRLYMNSDDSAAKPELDRKLFDVILLLTDSAGLGIFTVCGAKVAIDAGYDTARFDNYFLIIFVAVLTGVGGGVIRDIFAGNRPYIFIKHIYACASIAGAVVCALLWRFAGQNASMLAGFAVVTAIRLCAAKFRWSLPKA